MKNNIKISALVVAHNEQDKLASCLKKLIFADELVVVLDKTNDKSDIIAKKFGARVFKGNWNIEANRRNFGIKKCTGDWILEVDADEHVSKELFNEIRQKTKNTEPGYFLIPFDNYIGKRKIRYGWGASWGVSAAPRLHFKGCKIWEKRNLIHPSISLSGKKMWLKSRIKHYVDEDINDMILRLIRYTDLKAIDLAKQNKNMPHFLIIIRKGITRFFKCFISRKGYKEGKWGFIIAIMASLYIILSYMKASEIKEKK